MKEQGVDNKKQVESLKEQLDVAQGGSTGLEIEIEQLRAELAARDKEIGRRDER